MRASSASTQKYLPPPNDIASVGSRDVEAFWSGELAQFMLAAPIKVSIRPPNVTGVPATALSTSMPCYATTSELG